MGRSLLFAGLFAIGGLCLFALLAPLIFQGDMRQLGARAFPMVVIGFGALGFLIGYRQRRG